MLVYSSNFELYTITQIKTTTISIASESWTFNAPFDFHLNGNMWYILILCLASFAQQYVCEIHSYCFF